MSQHDRTPDPTAGAAAHPGMDLCQQVYRIATGAILIAFLLIIVLTTASTGPMVQFLGKALYYTILLSVVASLVTWLVRLRLEKKALAEPAAAVDG